MTTDGANTLYAVGSGISAADHLSSTGSPLPQRAFDSLPTTGASIPIQNANVNYVNFRQPNVSASCYQVASLNEHTAKKLSRKEAPQLIQYNTNNLLRVYPSGKRFDSSNFDPLIYWASGVQMVALNYQTDDVYLAVNQALFELNGLCGFVLKPEVLRSPAHVMYDRFNPWDKQFDGLYAIDLTVMIISGQHVLPDSANGSTLIEVEVLGIPSDCAKVRTKAVQRNSLNPIWNEMFEFRVRIVFNRFCLKNVKKFNNQNYSYLFFSDQFC